MTVLNTADAVYLGASAADKVYLGTNLVWSAAPDLQSASDDFNRANGALGSNWIPFTTDGGLNISGNQVVAYGSDGHAGAFWNGAFNADQYAEVTLGSNAFGHNDFAGAIVRASGTGTDFYCTFYFQQSDGTNELWLYKRVNNTFLEGDGGWLQSGDHKIQIDLVAGDVIRIEARGNFVHVYVNGALKLAGYDTDVSGGGTPGIMIYQHSNIPAITAFAGGEVASAAPGANTLVTDDFNRADGPVMGDVWTWAPNSTNLIYPVIQDNEVVQATSNGFPATGGAYLFGTWDDDQAVQCSVQDIETHAAAWAGITVRDNPIADTAYLAIYFNNSGAPVIALYKMTATNTYTQLGGNYNVPGGFTPNDLLRLEVVGTALTVKLNGATVISQTDATYTSGAPGFRLVQLGTVIDAWQGESLA